MESLLTATLERCFASSIQFSACGRFLYVIILSALVLGNNVDYSEVIVHFSSHRLLNDINLARSPVTTASYSRFVISLRNTIKTPLFSFTWTPKQAFISGSYRYMVLYRIDLDDQQPENPTPKESLTSTSSVTKSPTSTPTLAAVFVPTNHLALPAVVRDRTISFFPSENGLDTVVVGFRHAPKTALVFAVLLQPESLGSWVSLYSKENMTSASIQFSHEMEPHDPREEEFKCNGIPIRLRLTEDKKGEKVYRSADGVLQINQGESRSFSFSPYGGRGSSTSLVSFSMKHAKAGINRSTNSDFEIPLINLQNDDDPKSLDPESPKQDAKNDEDEERMMFQQLYDVVLASYAPRSDHEQGAYWRDINSIKSNTNYTSSLCGRCDSLHLTPDDFLHESCEEDSELFMNLVDRSVGGSYSFRCDSCRSKFEAPCDSYRCCICNNGDYDLCTSCYQAGEHCRSRSHVLRKTSFEHRYTDAKFYGISKDLDTTVPRWEGRLGTLQEVTGRTSCPLCRLSLESLRQSWQSEPEIPDSSDPDDEEKRHVTLRWRAFGWNQKRYHDQGRYLVAEYGGLEGRPIVLLSECRPFAPFTAYRLGAGQVNIPALQLWLKHCEGNHGWDCHPKPSQISKRGLTQFRAIDVVEKCVVSIPFPSRFVALSYVWGEAAQFCALQSTIGDLEKKGYLNEIQAKLSRTILDAIDFTNQMGERYLWVDALCIVQDDSESRDFLIEKMDLVFGSSAFTIIAAAGNGAEAGLPGVKPGSRRPQQVIEEINSDVRLTLLQPLETKLEQSIYETRGWTFQEKILSRRRFIFLPDGVYFQCERRVCREDFCTRRPDVVSSILQGTDRGISAASYFGTRPGRAYTPGAIFERLVESYLQRSLTIDSDILRGFQGLLGVLEQRFGFHFIAGMPIENLDSCLLWVSRRIAKRRAGFPSFSWAGWTGAAVWPAQEGVTHPFIPYALAENKSWYTNATYIEWHQCNPGHDPELVRSGDQAAYSWLLSKEKPSVNKYRPSIDSMGRPLGSHTDRDKTKGKSSTKDTSKEVPVEPNPRDSFSNVPEAVVREQHATPNQLSLNFRAIVIDVLLEETKVSSSRQSVGAFRYLELKCHHNLTHGFVAVPDQFECEFPGPGTLILLSNALPRYSISSNLLNTKPQTSGTPAYHVMLVQKSGDGTVERVGIGILEKSALSCELSEGPRWENIVLT
ncbi:heterokaryon incompatibility protein-domain-containing protein [Xylaria venustula]|nr:heterokaryon incompatibility protein-domain-containing protein [Xylaria venustula]